MPTVGVVSSNKLFRAGISLVLMRTGAIEALEAASLRELERICAALPAPDLLLIEATQNAADPAALVAEAKGRFADARVLLICDEVELTVMSRCFAAGLDGYLLADIGPLALVESVRLAQSGEKVFPSRLASLLDAFLQRPDGPRVSLNKIRTNGLSERDAEVLRLVAAGSTNKQIARQLGINDGAVKTRLKAILRKIGAGNRTEAAMWAVKHDEPALLEQKGRPIQSDELSEPNATPGGVRE